jgi:PAS domain S-box-containing protein
LVLAVAQIYWDGNPVTGTAGTLALLVFVSVAMVLLDRRGRWLALFAAALTSVSMHILWVTGHLPAPINRSARSDMIFSLITWLVASGIIAGVIGSTMQALRSRARMLRGQQEELRASEVKFRVLAESTPAGIVIIQGQEVVYANPYATTLSGYSGDELRAMPFLQLVHPAHRELVMARLQARLQGKGVPNRYEIRTLNKNGEVKWVDFSGVLLEHEGRPAVLATVFDVTERKKAENQIRKLNEELEDRVQQRTVELTQTSERLELATRAAQVGIWDWDIEQDVLVWDDTMYALYGIGKDDFSGAYQAWAQGLHPDDKGRAECQVQDVQQGNRDLDTEFRVIWPDGTIRHIRAIAASHRDENGQVRRMIGVNWDITAEKTAEETLRHSEDRFRAIIQDQTEFIVRYLPDTTRTFVNESYCRYTGRTDDDLVGTRILDELPAEEREGFRKRLLSLTPDEPVVTNEFRRASPDGGSTWESWTDRGIFDADGRLIEIQAVGRDITDRKRVLEELRMFNDAMVDREGRIIKLKEEVNHLAVELGRKIPYPPVWETEGFDLEHEMSLREYSDHL